jgi:phenylalanyl-tRNA synthetase alpha chain
MVSLDQVVEDAKRDFGGAADSAALEDAKARYLGKSGILTERLKSLGALDPEARKAAGAEINQIKSAVEAALNERRQALADAVLEARLSAEAIDVTLPGRGQDVGSLHPVMRTWERTEQIFRSIG